MSKYTIAVHSEVTATQISVSIIAANIGRITVDLYNNSNRTLWLKLDGTSAEVDKGTPVLPKSGREFLSFNGAINGIWENGATGDVQITEIVS